MPTLSDGRSSILLIVLIFGLACSSPGHAACIPKGVPAPPPQDPVALVLAAQNTCPKDSVDFISILKRGGARLEPTMVNFRGFHNPSDGAFFIFEIVSSDGPPSSAFTIQRGDLMFGHFTTATEDNRLVPNQSGLVIELISWDPNKQFYNFYELSDTGWFYRGDSRDILDDVKLLHRERSESAGPFGPRLRCSGCHVNGALLQKELAPPHNDWSVLERPLLVDPLKPDSFVKEILAEMKDAGELSKQVIASARRLADSPNYRKVLAARGMQEQLRPLFCPMELNIESDSEPFDQHKPTLHIPSAFFVDPRLATVEISIQRQHYDAALEKLHSNLPDQSGRVDADHGWLVPVKAQSDIVAVDGLIEHGVISSEFAIAVLAVDFTNPLFSKTRCSLLKLVPNKGGSDFLSRFQEALHGATVPGAAELLENLSNPARDAGFYKNQAQALLAGCQQQAADPAAVLDWYRLLAQRRIEVGESEISQNPKGHILEDPDRIVFPSTEPPAVAGRLTLTSACQVQ